MIFSKKKKDSIICENCESSIDKKYSFCPHCGNFLREEEDARDFGILGKSDDEEFQEEFSGFGITDKLVNSLVNSLAKTLDKQFKQFNDAGNSEIKSFPNGIKIRIGHPIQQVQKKAVQNEITESQIKKMSELPRATAKSTVKRLSDKVVYSMETPGINSKEDVFISRLESGYEVKAIGSKKVYVNSIPINLPIKNLSVIKNKLLLEFNTKEN